MLIKYIIVDLHALLRDENLNNWILDTISFKTISANKNTVSKNWVLVDADGQNLGRLASKVAILIRGKHKPNFTPHVDCGDNVYIHYNTSLSNLHYGGAIRLEKWYWGHTRTTEDPGHIFLYSSNDCSGYHYQEVSRGFYYFPPE